MNTTFRDQLGIHADALMLRERRNNLLASNIANAATPHYQARDMDFDAVLAEMTAKGGGDLRTTQAGHMSAALGQDEGVGYRVPTMPSLDGNTVELSVEQMEFAENTVRYQTSLQLLNRRISGLMSAIRGE